MSFFGDLERFLSEDLYPYRYALSVAAIVVAGLLAYAAYRAGLHRIVARHRYWSAGIGVPAIAVVLVVGYVLLSPLWTRTTLLESSPLATSTDTAEATTTAEAEPASSSTPTTAADDAEMSMNKDTPTATASPTEAAFEPRVVLRGEWMGADDFHFARGTALVIETEPGVYTVRVEDFSVRNGPDLFVYLSPDPDGYAEGGLNLGELKATDGAFNYAVPEGTDISEYRSVVVWCEAFSVLFGTATLMAG